MFLYNENTIEKIELFFKISDQGIQIQRSPVINLLQSISQVKFHPNEHKLICLDDKKKSIFIVDKEKIITLIKYEMQEIADFKIFGQYIMAVGSNSEIEIRTLTKCIYKRQMEHSVDVHFLPHLDIVINININVQFEIYLKSKDVLLDIISCNDYHQDLTNCFNFIFKSELNELIILENNSILRFFQLPNDDFFKTYFNKTQKVKGNATKNNSNTKRNNAESKKNLFVKIEKFFKSINEINIQKNKLILLEEEMHKLKELVTLTNYSN